MKSLLSAMKIVFLHLLTGTVGYEVQIFTPCVCYEKRFSIFCYFAAGYREQKCIILTVINKKPPQFAGA